MLDLAPESPPSQLDAEPTAGPFKPPSGRAKSVSLTSGELSAIHEASMALLARPGIRFLDDETVIICRHHGLRTDGQLVFFEEIDVLKALSTIPRSFTVRARNAARSVVIGGDRTVFAPAYGAPFITDQIGKRRLGTMGDYHDLTRLVHALPNQDMTGHLLVQPYEQRADSAHLHMLRSAMVHSDKPFMGSCAGAIGAQQTMDMASILFGEGPEALVERPVTLGLVDSLSPLQFSADTTRALMTYARFRQPLVMASLVMAGATGPVTLAGSLAQQNAELLAGIVLTQLVGPGTPVVYGSASSNMDMRTGTLAIGGPELALISAASIQLGQAYGLPSRGGGPLTDAHVLDAQSGLESMMGLLAATQAGADFILHASGIMSSFLAVSYEKFVLDDEMCGMVRRLQEGIAVTPDDLALDVIRSVGPGGNFLETAHTTDRCREAFFQPRLLNRDNNELWEQGGEQVINQRAEARWRALLADHEDPPLDRAIVRRLDDYVARHEHIATH